MGVVVEEGAGEESGKLKLFLVVDDVFYQLASY